MYFCGGPPKLVQSVYSNNMSNSESEPAEKHWHIIEDKRAFHHAQAQTELLRTL